MYDAEYTRKFYNAYGETKCAPAERSPYRWLQAITHNDFITRHVRTGDRVLDAGSGPGRFSISMVNLGTKVTVFNVSDTQLDLARMKLREAGLADGIRRFVRADISDLSKFPDASFDKVVCFGGALSYDCKQRQKAAEELRVTRPGGNVMVSVMSLLVAVIGAVAFPDMVMLNKPDKMTSSGPPLCPVLETGDLSDVPSRAGMPHALMHMCNAQELQRLFVQAETLETAGPT